MARLNITSSKEVSKKAIHLWECECGALIKINGSYFIYPDYDFDNDTPTNEIGLLNLQDGAIYFFDMNISVKIYDGEITINEEDFKEFQ